MSEKIIPFPNGALSQKESNILIHQLLSRINHMFLPNKLCLSLLLYIKSNSCPKPLNRMEGEITVQEGICYLKCILVASSTVPQSKSLTGHVDSSPPPALLHKKSGDCLFKHTTEEDCTTWQGETEYFMLGILLPLASNPEAATFCRGGNDFVLRIT